MSQSACFCNKGARMLSSKFWLLQDILALYWCLHKFMRGQEPCGDYEKQRQGLCPGKHVNCKTHNFSLRNSLYSWSVGALSKTLRRSLLCGRTVKIVHRIIWMLKCKCHYNGPWLQRYTNHTANTSRRVICKTSANNAKAKLHLYTHVTWPWKVFIPFEAGQKAQ